MKKFILLCAAIALLVATATQHASAEKVSEKSCKAIVTDLIKTQMVHFTVCNKEMKFKNGKEKTAKSNCVLKCTGIKAGLLSSEGLVSKELAEAFLKKFEIPKFLLDKAPPFFACIDSFGALIDPTEEFCKTYDPILKCMVAAAGDLCK